MEESKAREMISGSSENNKKNLSLNSRKKNKRKIRLTLGKRRKINNEDKIENEARKPTSSKPRNIKFVASEENNSTDKKYEQIFGPPKVIDEKSYDNCVATIPDCCEQTEANMKSESFLDEQIWDPKKGEVVDSYLSTIKSSNFVCKKKGTFDEATHLNKDYISEDLEKTLELLHKENYDAEAAMKQIEKNSDSLRVVNNWSVADVKLFLQGFERFNDKSISDDVQVNVTEYKQTFHLIQKNTFPLRQHIDLVRVYFYLRRRKVNNQCVFNCNPDSVTTENLLNLGFRLDLGVERKMTRGENRMKKFVKFSP